MLTAGNEELVRAGFDASLRGDRDALADVMAADVGWLWYEPGEWDCHDREKVLATLFDRQRAGLPAEYSPRRRWLAEADVGAAGKMPACRRPPSPRSSSPT